MKPDYPEPPVLSSLPQSWINVFGASTLIILTGLINWPLFLAMGFAENRFRYLMGDAWQLPLLTQKILSGFPTTFGVGVLLSCLAIFGLVWKRFSKPAWWLAVTALMYSGLHFFVVTTALMLPIIELYKVMSG